MSFLISSLADPMALFVFFVPFVAIELQMANQFGVTGSLTGSRGNPSI